MRIKELREQKCLSQLDVAKGINTSQRNVGRWETGANEPSSSFILKLADFFDVSTDYLLGREDDFGNVATSGVALSSQEQRILMVYRALSERDKKTIENLFETLSPTGVNNVRA